MTIQDAKKATMARGKRELIAHLEGKRLSYRAMALAKCYECNGGYPDGKADCGIKACPLYPKMPFNRHALAVEHQKNAQPAMEHNIGG